MENERIKELQDISNDFLRKLGEDDDYVNLSSKPLQTEVGENEGNTINTRKLNMPNFSKSLLYKRQKNNKASISKDIFKPLKPWKPNDLMGRTLNQFQILRDGHCLSDWEKERMPLVLRSYEKPANMLSGKDFVCRNLFGERFDKNVYRDGYDIDHAQKNLSPIGKDIIKKFIEQNKAKSNLMDLRKEQLYNDFHSKSPKRGSLDYNNVDSFKVDIFHPEKINERYYKKIERPIWKYGLHAKGEFGPLLVDRYHIFDEPPKRKYDLNQPPFRRPKDEGDYFDKDIHILGGPYDKLYESVKA